MNRKLTDPQNTWSVVYPVPHLTTSTNRKSFQPCNHRFPFTNDRHTAQATVAPPASNREKFSLTPAVLGFAWTSIPLVTITKSIMTRLKAEKIRRTWMETIIFCEECHTYPLTLSILIDITPKTKPSIQNQIEHEDWPENIGNFSTFNTDDE